MAAVLPEYPVQPARVVVVLAIDVERVPRRVDLHAAHAAGNRQHLRAAHREVDGPLAFAVLLHDDPHHGGQTAVAVVADRDPGHVSLVGHAGHGVVGVAVGGQHLLASAAHARPVLVEVGEELPGVREPVPVPAGILAQGFVEGALAHLGGELAHGEGALVVDHRREAVLVLAVDIACHREVETRLAQRVEPGHQPLAEAAVVQQTAGKRAGRTGVAGEQVVVRAVLPLQVVQRHVLGKRLAEPVVADEVHGRADAEVEVADLVRHQELQHAVPQLRRRQVGVERAAAQHHEGVRGHAPCARPHPLHDGDAAIVQRPERAGVVVERLGGVAGELARLALPAGTMEQAHDRVRGCVLDNVEAVLGKDGQRNGDRRRPPFDHVGSAVRSRRGALVVRDHPVPRRDDDAHAVAGDRRQREPVRAGVEARIPGEALHEHAVAAGHVSRAQGRQPSPKRDGEPVAVARRQPQPHGQAGHGIGEQAAVGRRRELLERHRGAERVDDARDPRVARFEPGLVAQVLEQRVHMRVGDGAGVVEQEQHRVVAEFGAAEGDHLRAGDDRRGRVVGQVELVADGRDRRRLQHCSQHDEDGAEAAQPIPLRRVVSRHGRARRWRASSPRAFMNDSRAVWIVCGAPGACFEYRHRSDHVPRAAFETATANGRERAGTCAHARRLKWADVKATADLLRPAGAGHPKCAKRYGARRAMRACSGSPIGGLRSRCWMAVQVRAASR